ncbi:S-layer homology domain-containing protein [Paenibacillus sp. F411]|uniref:S-layer homology domain-containing protein n=1 Tax=Paenibacillus sp. F411 TaxID=2820239 RepID=UPI001AAEFD84|nr:S-layer homology domain-containing protein [Paenibacillus sp. F411]MBO2942398.1 S-layer homology domain-containing protein [Paenibacillus sp. F411]
MNRKKWKGILSGLLCSALLITSFFASTAPAGYAAPNMDELPENIRTDKADFDTIPEVAEFYKAKFGEDAVAYFNSINGESRIQRINFLQYPEGQYLEINGEEVIDIPDQDARIWRLFSDLRFEGSAAQTMELYIIDPNGVETEWTVFKNGGWKDKLTGLYTNYTKMGFQESNPSEAITHPWLIKDNGENVYEGYKMKIKGNGTLRSVYHWEEEGVPLEFDISAWTVLGEDKDILDVSVEVDALTNLSMNGVNKLPEDVFKRYHINSGPIGIEQAGGEFTVLDEAYHKTTKDWGFIPGRGAFHYKLLTDWAGLKEDPARPGYADFTEVNKIYTKSQPAIHKFESLYPSIGKDYVLTMDGWPKWMWENPESGQSEHFGTPGYEHFDAAAEASAQLIKSIDTRLDGLGPKYVEVKNESTIPQEWWFLQSEPDKAWGYLSEFHNKVAAAVKAKNPDVLVGGPSSAFMYLEKNDFDEARAQLKFMDETKDSLDWYSHHFYENANLFIHDRENNSDGFLSGRLEAVLDLLNAHMVNTDNVKPIYITEEGTYNTAGSDADYFQKLVAFNGYMLRFMNYSDSIGMLVPYLYPIINWKPDSTGTFYKYNENKNGLMEEMTPMEAYLDMWKDYRGAYLPSQSDHERVHTNAVRYNDKVYVAVHNLNAQRVHLDLDVLAGNANIDSVTRKHFFLEKGELTYEEDTVTDLEDVYMRVQEMSIFEITLDSNPDFTGTWNREFAYASEELIPLSDQAPAVVTIQQDAAQLAKSTLRIGFGKTGSGFAGDMTVVVNPGEPEEQTFTKDLNYTNKPGNLLTYAEFELEPSKVLAQNTIEIRVPDRGGYVTSVQLIQYDEQAAPSGVDTEALRQPIAEAKSTLSETVISATGNEVQPGAVWIKQHIHDTLSIEVTKAEIVAEDALATAEEVESAVINLNKALAIFEQYATVKSEPTGSRGAQFSFEDGEPAAYTYDADSVTATVVSQNATEGSQALKVDFDKLTSYAWDSTGKYSGRLTFTAPEEGWSLGGKPFTFDVANLNNQAAQLRVEITDQSDHKGIYYYALAAGASRKISISEFQKASGTWLADGNFPRTADIDTENLKSIQWYVFGPTAAPIDRASLVFDHVVIGVAATAPEPEPEPGEPPVDPEEPPVDPGVPPVTPEQPPVTPGVPPVTPAPPAAPAPPVVPPGSGSTVKESEITILINGKPSRSLASQVVENRDSRSVTTVTLNASSLKESLSQAANGSTLRIPVSGSSHEVAGVFSGEVLEEVGNKEVTIELVSEQFAYMLPVQLLQTEREAAAAKEKLPLKEIGMDIRMSQLEEADMAPVKRSASAKGYTLAAPAFHFEISLSYNEKTTAVNALNGFVERAIALPDGIARDDVSTGVRYMDHGAFTHVPTAFSTINGRDYAVMNSMSNSIYTLLYHTAGFTDVQNHWAEAIIQNLGSRLIVEGVGAGNFEPNRSVTRAEFATMVVKALGLHTLEGGTVFPDVEAGSWYSPYVNAAAQLQLIAGYDHGQFKPLDSITREQAMTILQRGMHVAGMEAEVKALEAEALLRSFTDAGTASSYAKSSLAAGIKSGLLLGRDGSKLAPKAYVTRAETAAMLERMLKKAGLM